MNRRFPFPLPFVSLLVLLALATLPIVAPLSARAAVEEPVAVTSGKVVGFSTDTSLLTVNTRLGVKRFTINSTTLLLLNNHTTTTQNITANDDVSVEYFYPSLIAKTVHLFRESKRSGHVTAVSDTSLSVRLSSGASMTFTLNTSTELELEGIPLTSSAILLNRRVTVIYEPVTTPLALSVAGQADTLSGRLASTNATGNTITLAGGRTLRVDAHATIRRAGKVASLSDLQAGDKLKMALAGKGSGRRVLALRATPR